MNRFARLTAAFGVVFAMVLGAPTPAKADPITAAIVTAVGLTGTAAAVATFVVNGLFTTAFSWAAGKLLGKSKASVQERQASVTTLSLGEVPREALIGEAVTGGSLIDAFNHGGQYGTDYVTRCIALVDHAVDDLVGYYIDDQYYAFSANGVQGGFSGALDIEFVNATEAGAAPPARFLTASGGSWVSTDVLAGITHVWFSYKCDEAVWPQGHPQVRFLLRGLKAYDPRKDAALGYVGAGAQTWSDPSTHTFTRNAALLRYAFARGIYAEGRQGEPEHLLIGRGLSAEEAPPEPVIAAANLCDEDVDGKARYTANGVIRASDDFIFVEEMFAAAMAGVIVQREGGVEIEPGQAKAAVVTITDADLVVGEPVSFSEFLSDGDGGRINTVIPRYIEPAQTWKDHSGPVRRDLDDIAADGGPREITLPLMLVTEGAQADRCAEITRLLGRLEKRATIVLPPEYGRLEEGDWIAWTSARRFGGATVRFRIESWTLDEKWRMRLSLREIAAAAYGEPDPLTDESDPPSDPLDLDPLELQDVTAEVVALGGAGSAMPGVRFTWSPADPAVIAIRAEVRRAGETVAASTRTDEVGDLSMTVTNGVGPDQGIEARLVPITRRSRPVTPSDWFALTTGALTAGDVTRLSPVRRSAIDAQANQVLQQFEASVAEQIRRHEAGIATQALINHIGVVDPTSGTVVMAGDNIRIGAETLGSAVTRVDKGLGAEGEIQVQVPREVSELSGIYNEQIEITADGELVINNPAGPVSGGQVQRVLEATANLGFDAVVRRAPAGGPAGGRMFLQKPLTDTILHGDLAIDMYADTLRIFDATTIRGLKIDMTKVANSIGSKLLFTDLNGRVGIGLDSPDGLLHVQGVGPGGTAQFTGTTHSTHFNYGSGETTFLRGGKATSEIHIGDVNSGNISLAYGGGSVGIGTLSPETKLHATGTIRSRSAGGGYVDLVPGDGTWSGRMEFFSAAGARSGYVGFSNTSQLLMGADTGYNWAFDKRVDLLAGAQISGIWRFDHTSGIMNWGAGYGQGVMSWDTGLAILGAQSGSALALFANGSEKARFLADGSVGIGKTNPSYALDVVGSIRAHGGALIADSDQDAKLFFYRTGANTLSFEHDATRVYLYDRTVGAVRWSVNQTTGNFGIGSGALDAVTKFHVDGPIRSGAGAIGSVQLEPGDGTYSGRVDFKHPNGGRTGYVGFTSGTSIIAGAETGFNWAFDKRVDLLAGAAVTGDITASGAMHAAGFMRARTGGGGYIQHNPGDATYTGYTEFYSAAGTRLGYIGYGSGSTLVMAAEGSVTWAFDKQLRMLAGAAVTGALSVTTGDFRFTGGGAYSEPAINSGVLSYDSTGGGLTLSARSNGGNTHISLRTSSGGTGTEKVRIAHDGKVGVGTTTPRTRLDLGSSGGFMRTLNPGSATGLTYVGQSHNDLIEGAYVDGSGYSISVVSFGHVADPGRKYQIGSGSNSAFDGGTTFVPHLTMLADGKVGIGTAAPQTTLQVAGEIRARGASTGFVSLNPGDARPGYVSYHTDNGTRRGYMGFSNGSDQLIIASENGYNWAFTQRPIFNGATPWDSANFNPATKVGNQDGARYTTDFNTLQTSGFYNAEASPSNCPSGHAYGQIIVAKGVDTGMQIAGGYNNDLYHRGWGGGGSTFFGWRKVWDSSHFDAENLNASKLTTGTLPLARNDQLVWPLNGVPRDNLGNPSLRESVFPAQFNNKVAFFDPSLVTIETTTDGTTWTALSGVTDDQKRSLLTPAGGSVQANISIPYNSCTKFRVTIGDAPGYDFLNALYMWWSANGNSYKVHVWKQDFAGTWTQHTSSDVSNSNWPGHLYLPFDTIPYQNVNEANKYKKVRFEFTPTWAGYSTGFALDNMEVWGGYPAGRRTIYDWDNRKNIIFPAGLTTVGSVGIGTASPTARAHIDDGGSNVPGLLIHKTLGGQPHIRLTTNFAGGSTVDLQSSVPGINNGGFALTVDTIRRMWFLPGGDSSFNVAAGCGYHWQVDGTDVALLEANGTLSVSGLNIGGYGAGVWADWSPTPSAETGSATGLAMVYAERERQGKTVTINFAVAQTAINTAGTSILVPLPFAAKVSRSYFGAGKNFNTGADLRVEAVGSNLRITAANNYPMGSGAESLAGSITYQCA